MYQQDSVDLIENNEYGHDCLIRAAKQILDKNEIENPTATQIYLISFGLDFRDMVNYLKNNN